MVTIDYSALEILIATIREKSGFDFSGYTRPSLLRRTQLYLTKHAMTMQELFASIDQGGKVVYDLIQDLTVNYSEMFRDPDFFEMLVSEVFSYLESYTDLRIWVAGCASGEEAFSLSILLNEAKLGKRTIIYATDLSQKVLSLARDGVYSRSAMRGFSEKYLLAGGKTSLSDYYHVAYGKAVMNPELRKNIVFSIHDLTGDGVFNEFQLITCRNVMIYFTLELRRKVFQLLYNSLAPLGFLCLGKRETLRYSGLEDRFRVISGSLNIYQKIS
ncbi:protein-glutamate O-methyltransferase CheR [Dyadobacter sp. CY312]|uniref:CheR family methyltransferase n=1 Tax=Dyadobacter sp. CY312 TaxID=2907303 RepID=UPI001F3CD299|nr:CheR family methyltransferase [Dyadobacter sp. CY312]MCE7039377.1 chemotaxis protein CheR [Dyadobacter sp. CY312]